MAIKAGQIIHTGDTVLVQRLQTAGPGNLNIPTQKIYELGNYKSEVELISALEGAAAPVAANTP